MTKWIFAFLFFSCFLFSSGVQAQGHYRNNAIGVYIGPNFSNIDITSPQLNADSKSGYQAGIYYRSGKFVYGQAGLQFQKMNSNFQMTDSTPDVSDDLTFKRIQLPLYGGLNLIPIIDGVLNIRVFAGPVISYDFNISENDLPMYPEDFSRFRVEGALGAGIDVLIFSLDGGYSFGLSNLFNDGLDGKCSYGFVNLGLKF